MVLAGGGWAQGQFEPGGQVNAFITLNKPRDGRQIQTGDNTNAL